MSYADEIFRRSANERVHAGCDEREAELEAEVERLRERMEYAMCVKCGTTDATSCGSPSFHIDPEARPITGLVQQPQDP